MPPSLSFCTGIANIPHGALDEVARHLDEGEKSGVGNPHPPCNPGACIVTNLDPNEIDPVRTAQRVPMMAMSPPNSARLQWLSLPQCPQHHNWTALHWAAMYDHHHVIQHLMDVGADIHARNSVRAKRHRLPPRW